MDSDERKVLLFQAWDELSSRDMLPFHKLLTGGFRMGVSKGNLCKALALVSKVEPAVIAQRIAGNWSCENLSMEQILNPEKDSAISIHKPYPFCLASPLQEEVSSIGDVNQWQVEWKWDGIRAQLLTTGGGSGMIWSRGEESIEESFPELLKCIPYLPAGICMDGEILAWGREGLRPFHDCRKDLDGKVPDLPFKKRVSSISSI